jgi:hypothetical protein
MCERFFENLTENQNFIDWEGRDVKLCFFAVPKLIVYCLYRVQYFPCTGWGSRQMPPESVEALMPSAQREGGKVDHPPLSSSTSRTLLNCVLIELIIDCLGRVFYFTTA